MDCMCVHGAGKRKIFFNYVGRITFKPGFKEVEIILIDLFSSSFEEFMDYLQQKKTLIS